MGLDANGTVGVLDDLWEFNVATNQWVWIGGNDTIASSCFTYDIGKNDCAQPGVYGNLGTPAPGNRPGSRAGATGWTDNNGNLWLFGGWGFDVANQVEYYFNDLWEFNTSTKQWAWMGGSSNGSGSACFSSPDLFYLSCGEPGVYGTLGVPSAVSNPGARNGATGWTDNSGNLWLFGGQGFDTNGRFSDLNDVWEFTPATNQWVWKGGPNTVYDYYAAQTGVYGTLGTADPANIPPTRYDAASWKDKSGNLWLFGGERTGWYGNSFFSMLYDLWQFDPTTNQWIWMGGNNSNITQKGVYGILGTAALGNEPGLRTGMSSWSDTSGNFWLFGGQFFGQYSTGGSIFANDVWKYQPSAGPLPTAPAPTFNVPGGTYIGNQIVTISDAANGATIYYTLDGTTPTTTTSSSSSSQIYYGSLTVGYPITIKALAVVWGAFDSPVATAAYTFGNQAAAPTFSPLGGSYLTAQTVTLSDATPGAKIYYNHGEGSLSASSTLYTGPIAVSTTGPIVAVARAAGYSDSNIVSAEYEIGPPAPAPTFNLASGTYTGPQQLTISDTIPYALIYYTTDGSTPTLNSTAYTGPITLSGSETIKAIAEAGSYGYTTSSVATATYTINATPAAVPNFNLPSGTYSSSQSVSISEATIGAKIFYTTDGSTPTRNSTLYSGPITVSSSETINAIAGGSGYIDSAVTTVTYTINLPVRDFSLALSPASLSVKAGQNTTDTVSITPLNGFNSAVSFSCSGLPAGATCSFSPANVTPSGAATSTTLTLTAPATAALVEENSRPFLPGSALAIAAGCFWFMKPRFNSRSAISILPATFIVLALSLLNGCGSGSSAAPRPPVTSTITITATAGSLQHTATLSLTVN